MTRQIVRAAFVAGGPAFVIAGGGIFLVDGAAAARTA
jgi:hypothetical protein